MSEKGKAKGSWDATADRALLVSIIAGQGITVDNRKIAEQMQSKGYGFNEGAIKNRIARLKAEAKKGEATADGDSDTTPKPKGTSGRKRGAATSTAPDESPSKKSKGSKGKALSAAAALDDELIKEEEED